MSMALHNADDVVACESKKVPNLGWAMGVQNQPAEHETSLTTCPAGGCLSAALNLRTVDPRH